MTIPLPDALYATQLAPFVDRAFRALNPGQAFLWGDHIRAMTQALEAVERGDLRRLIITLPPRHLKSHTVSVAFPAWVLGRDPRRRIVAASYAQDLAQVFSRQTRGLMQQPWYRRAFPDTRLAAHTTQDALSTTRHGLRLATSVGGTLTGKGGDLILVDDPMKAADAHSETARRAVREWWQGTLSSRLDNPRPGAMIVVAQRLHPDDLVGFLLEHSDFAHLDLPAIAETVQRLPIGHGLDFVRQPGDLLHPERLDHAELDRLKRELGTLAFEAQYQQRPAPAEGHLVKRRWFPRFDLDAVRPGDFDLIVQSWDTAEVPGETNDYSVCTTWGLVDDTAYLLDVLRERLGYPDLRRRVIARQRAHQAHGVIIEGAANGRALFQDLRREGHLWVRTLNPEGDKISRLARQSAKIEQGRVLLPTEADWLAAYEDELTGFPNTKYDDQVDSTTQLLRALDYDLARRLLLPTSRAYAI